ncbi:MAG: thiamine pyrophosphate-dependent dehydrogenase E1 component subunit alpha [Chloroflexota bacterium]|uniref:Dehydrogenase E1 component domain-containing protein n=1 Tax=marine metagenome TaxID=408172 RepID=A0A381UWJ0_9ZZZZ|nr:pyruvate dehydrogenase (acetyl-transferring) E1 component subunit alpha [Dehalococcoidia bacterium]MCH2314033.1 thiamine pyrophosphate-dependent dehydrogenase E1 component subunit alpha [SAR202 cluster bacterium]MEC7912772.1 thiamine pyrophosphate-dependent dehydrogenase E1 component subunit alpha [Chloroflexota bacterium]MEC9278672.1 thiamine pyrophosphate-dependent dehydrogenase E1 component subunit alpha [Chloroflexota bacterium]HAT21529.1 pyruvate dehydrogenase (acetyl-transferring) E1 c|tara:strand:+ start:1207 stop:2196 length:990 start_codon:yes stop_codon:yes gene_type:complete
MPEGKELYMLMLRRMMLIRKFDETVKDLVQSAELVGMAHCYIGEEAVAVGACTALRDEDYITGNHRSHGHPISKGGDVRRAMAELLGKATGYCKGKGGSMHLADFDIGILGESGIVASALPVAVGAAMGSKMQNTDRVVISFFGDGASNQGACHEAMNLASIWKLPVIFLCENNQYAVTTSFKETVSTENVSDRATAYNMPGVLVDGQDVMAMHEATVHAVQRARAGEGPTLLEAKTYRYEDHSEGLNRILREPYRTEEEIEFWRQRDPIDIHSKWLLENDVASQEEIDKVQNDVYEAIGDALQFARESPYPDEADLFTDLFADPIPLR